MHDAFKHFDKDNSGFITAEELHVGDGAPYCPPHSHTFHTMGIRYLLNCGDTYGLTQQGNGAAHEDVYRSFTLLSTLSPHFPTALAPSRCFNCIMIEITIENEMPTTHLPVPNYV